MCRANHCHLHSYHIAISAQANESYRRVSVRRLDHRAQRKGDEQALIVVCVALQNPTPTSTSKPLSVASLPVMITCNCRHV